MVKSCSKLVLAVSVAGLLLLLGAAQASIIVPGADGSDGAFNPTGASYVVDLSQAVTGHWDDNNAANAGKGVYDPEKWAVVFKYSSVNIPTGVTVKFTNNASHAPVVWLVSGDARISGRINLDGTAGSEDDLPGNVPEPGPGGFRGGTMPTSLGMSAGYGPGGASYSGYGSGAAYANQSQQCSGNTISAYGNSYIMPLVGGSGGSSNTYGYVDSGGAGGGAILLACASTCEVVGSISSAGGSAKGYGASCGTKAPCGSGGAVRIVAQTFQGAGTISVPGGVYAGSTCASTGRIRVDAASFLFTGGFSGAWTQGAFTNPVVLWPVSTTPSVKVAQIAGIDTPLDPTGSNAVPDVSVTTLSSVIVRLAVTNVPGSWTVAVRMIPRYGVDVTATATRVSGDDAASVYQATITPPQGVSVIQARAYKP